MKRFKTILIPCLLVCCTLVKAQRKASDLIGFVKDSKGQAIEFASIFCEETQSTTFSDSKGRFVLSLPFSLTQVNIRVTAVGRKTVERKIEKRDYQNNIYIILHENSLTLKEVQVSSTYAKSRNSISSISFDEEAIERVQAFSLMDVLNTLPGKQLTAPNINTSQTLSLRNTLGGTYDLNNSLGIPIIVDGITLSNDANMQSRPITQRGMSGAVLPATNGSFATDVPFRGIDLRELPVESIEKIEVIQGVASAEYGELTDGAIIIERKSGKTPLQFTTNLNAGSTNYSLNKGFNLPHQLGGLSTDFNYAISNNDPRDRLQEYRRYGFSARWHYRISKTFTNKFSLDLNRKIDEGKLDPDDGSRREYYSKQNGFRLSNQLAINLASKYLNRIELSLSYSASRQDSYNQWFINQLPKGYTAKDTTGIYEGVVISGNYLAIEQIVGRPVTASGNLKFSSFFKIGHSLHKLSYGINSNYTNNGGKGIVYDPDRPRFVNLNSTNIRPYSFELNPSIVNTGIYFTDNIHYKLLGKNSNANLGIRVDSQNGSLSLQPRLSTQIQFNKAWNLGLAYGISSKSPTLAQRYPPPAWIDIPLIYALNSDAALYLVYTEKYKSSNPHLKPSKSSQAEINLSYHNKIFSSRINAFYKAAKNGFNSVKQYQQVTLPNFDYYYDSNQQKFIYYENGTSTNHFKNSFYSIYNALSSNTYGFDWSWAIHKISALNTSLTTSTSVITSQENNPVFDIEPLSSPQLINGKLISYAIYRPLSNDKKTVITSKLNTSTHIPSLGFVVMTNTDFFWYNKRKSQYKNALQPAIGYLDQNLKQVLFTDGQNNPLPTRNLSLNTTDQKLVYAVFSMSVAKEINKRIRIAVTAYNTFNIHPEYSYTDPNTGNTSTTVYAPPLSITGGISLKL